MKNMLENSGLLVIFLLITCLVNGQNPPPLGVTSSFVIYTSVGAVTNTGVSQITGDIGTGAGAVTGFGNINGSIHTADATTAQCGTDLTVAYDNVNSQTAGASLALTLGAGQVLTPNIYLVSGASTFTGSLTLDGLGDPNACFIFKLDGAFAAAASSRIILANGTQACNVFWRIDGATAFATNTIWKGTTLINGATALATGCHLEGRLLNITGAIDVSNLIAGPPLGCGSPILNGPQIPDMNTICDYAIFTSTGSVTNTGTTNVVGDIGTNSGIVSNFNPVGVSGNIHTSPNASTAQAKSSLDTLYTYLSGLSYDIELLYPSLFGYGQVLTPNVYLINAATTLTDTIFLDARGVMDAVFVIRIIGALTTGTSPQVVLVGGTQAINVFWQIEGAVTISSGANFNGIMVANNAAFILNTGVLLNGKILSTNGNINTGNVNITSPNCPATLPIELLSFTATARYPYIELNWTTVSENNSDYFNIERSIDGINFTSISKINSAGNSSQTLNYSTFDYKPLVGKSYYHLKQTDYDGENSYSNTEVVEFNIRSEFIFEIYPNPFSGKTTFHTTKNLKDATLIVYDSYGLMVKEIINISGQTFNFERENLSSGLYYVNLIENAKVIAIDKLVITEL
jgi:hypothetical protein